MAEDREVPRAVKSRRYAQPVFFGIAALSFIASAAVTTLWSLSMAAMDGMPMAGGWTLSMGWVPLCGETGIATTIGFLGMWGVMMVAMMLPSLLPALWRYHEAASLSGTAWSGPLTLLAGVGYFLVWILLGLVIFLAGSELSAIAMRYPEWARAVPGMTGGLLLAAGLFQVSPWKAHMLARCRNLPGHGDAMPADGVTALQSGLRLGLRCCLSCAGLVAILLVLGVMDLGAMVVVTAAITLERLAPVGLRVAEAIGCVTAVAGVMLITRAAGFA